MPISRGNALKLVSGAGAAALAGVPLGARAQAKRTLDIQLLGNGLGIHVPGTAAIFEGIPAMAGLESPKVTRIDQIRTLAANLVAGSTELATSGPTGIFGADEQGGDVKIIGYFYRNTSLVFVANVDKIKTYKDLEKAGNIVAVNGRGDITEVMLLGPLIKNGVDLSKVQFVEIGGSSGRMRALLAGRVAAVPVHFDQAAEIAKQGPYKNLFEPWTFYKNWVNEAWAAKGSWLRKPENRRAAVDVLKATTLAFRRANRDFAWYVQMYHAYCTLPDAKTATEATLRPLWTKLATEVKAWPDQNILTPADFRELLPIYRSAGDITGSVRVSDVVDSSLGEQAMKELGRQGL
ncbi:MAG: ABC transporter substrate-binding protein [Candidatus Eremiobacteraeota bacterium]|nr:ABC transporter substrate-binding protein [Candidatus Eremiobacteraeota bacterium]MBV8354485.1 ABC transporter substrate-binding protein [Candidatus Eremiobacteraeota bacterium]